MVNTMKALLAKYTVTLEASKTGLADSSDWPPNQIPLDLPVGTISGIFTNANGTGTNFWTAYDGSMSDGWIIHLSVQAAATIGVDTAVWVTYDTDVHPADAAGVVLPGRDGVALVMITAVLMAIKGENDWSTPVDYEITSLTTGQTLAAEIRFVPPLKNVTITEIDVITDGTDVDIGIYAGTATTGTWGTLIFKKETINTQWYSSQEFPSLRVVIEDDAFRLGIVDNGVNATPANTKVILRGHPAV